MKYFLGVDGGASKTAALVIDDSGKSLGNGLAGPSNHLRVGIETAARNIERAVNKALYDMKPEDLAPYVYAQTTQTDDIARFGKLVMEAAQEGDETARAILDRAGGELAAAVLAVARRLQLIRTAFPVAYVGGAFSAGDALL